MIRENNFNYIEEKLNILAYRIKQRGKLNLLELNIHSECFFAELLNLIFDWKLKNLNIQNHNVEGIDLIDDENKIIIQVSATATKRKIECSLKRDSISQYDNYMFKFLYIAGNVDKLRKEEYEKPNNIKFNSFEDIIDITYILKNILVLSMEKQAKLKDFFQKELEEKTNVFSVNTECLPIKGRFTNRVFRTDSLDKGLCLYGGLPFIGPSCGEGAEIRFLLDEVIEERIYDLFIDNPVENEVESDLLKNLEKRKSDNFTNTILKATHDYTNMQGEDSFVGNIAPVFSDGSYFFFVMPSFIIIHVFRIYINIDHLKMRKYYSVEPVMHIDKKLADGNIASAYYVEKKQDIQFIIVGFDKREKSCYFSNGILKQGKVRMSHFEYKSISTCFTTVDKALDNLYINCSEDNNRLKEGEKYFDTALDSPIIIIDPFDGTLILREKYYDKDDKEWRARIKMKIGYSYFVFSIYSADNKNELSLEEIGDYYHKGEFGFPQNTILAIKYYEMAKSAEGYYKIGKIFFEDEELIDLKNARTYIRKSAEMGYEKAKGFIKYLIST